MCPVCLQLIAVEERYLVSHLLSRHPIESLGISLLLSAANIVLAKRPSSLLRVDIAVLLAAIILARWPGSPH